MKLRKTITLTAVLLATGFIGARLCFAEVSPIGNLDVVDCGQIGGWAFDPDSSATSIQVHIYEGDASSGRFLQAVTANIDRPDVRQLYGITGNHGFSFAFPDALKDGLPHVIHVYAIDSTGLSGNPDITQSPMTSPACGTPPPQRCFDTHGLHVCRDTNDTALFYNTPVNEVAYNVQTIRDGAQFRTVYHSEPRNKPQGSSGDSLKTGVSATYGSMPTANFLMWPTFTDTASVLYQISGGANPMTIKGPDGNYYIYFVTVGTDGPIVGPVTDPNGPDRLYLAVARTSDFQNFYLYNSAGVWTLFNDATCPQNGTPASCRPGLLRDATGGLIRSNFLGSGLNVLGIIGSMSYVNGLYYYFEADYDPTGANYYLYYRTTSNITDPNSWSAMAQANPHSLLPGIMPRVSKAKGMNRWVVLYNGYNAAGQGDVLVDYTDNLNVVGTGGISDLALTNLYAPNGLYVSSPGPQMQQQDLLTDPFGNITGPDDADTYGGYFTGSDFNLANCSPNYPGCPVYGGKVYRSRWKVTQMTAPTFVNWVPTASGTVGQAFQYKFTTTGSPTVTLQGALPAGLNFNGIDTISGTPTTGTPAGGTTVTFHASNSAGSVDQTLTLTINTPPKGNVDGLSGTHILGWAYDPDHPSSPLSVHFYVDGTAGDSTAFAGIATTDVQRDDVNSVLGITGTHGFSFAIPVKYQDGKPHSLYAYGIDLDDTSGLSNTQLQHTPLTFTLTAAPPTANAQTLTTNFNTALPITLTGSDPNNLPLTYTVTANPTHGTLSGTAPNVTYTPNLGYSGSDSLIFKVNNGSLDSAVATVSLTVSNPAAPSATTQSVNTLFNTPLGITLSGSDPINLPLTYIVTAAPTHGVLTGSGSNLTYTPNAGYTGTDSLTFKVNNGFVDSQPATVSINVASPSAPIANAQVLSTSFNTALAITLTGSDPNNLPLIYTVTATPVHGTLSGTAPDVTYTPSSNYAGSDSFSFKVNNGSVDSSVATVSLTVSNPSAPSAAAQSVNTPFNTPAMITLAGSDPNNLPLTYTVTASPAHGSMAGSGANQTYTPNSGYFGPDSLTFKVNNGVVDSVPAVVSITVGNPAVPTATAQSVNTPFNVPLAITLTGGDQNNLPLIYTVTANPTHGTLSGAAPNETYTPTSGYAGPDSFSFKVNNGFVDSQPAIVSINVASPSAPNANAQVLNTPFNAALAITLTGSDPNNLPLTYTVTAAPTHGVLTGSGSNLTYTPNSGYSGPDSLTFKVNNGLIDSTPATVSITVSNPQAPVITGGGSMTIPLNQPFSYQITASNSPTSYSASGLPTGLSINAGSGLISGTPTTAGTFPVTLSAMNPGGMGTAILNLTLSELPTILPPDLTGVDGRTFTPQDELVVRYNGQVTGFNWEFNALDGQAQAPSGVGARALATVATGVPRLSLASLNLPLGRYQVRVQAVNGAQMSNWAAASITLASANLTNAHVYPNPFRATRGDTTLTFDQMPANSTVKIFTVSGRWVRTLTAPGGSVEWDLLNDSGDKAASGLYIYLVTDGTGHKTRGKFTVIR